MHSKEKILIINTGGTFNKIYEPISGRLIVAQNNHTLDTILKTAYIENISVEGLLFKDSLDITSEDRNLLQAFIEKAEYTQIIIVHGTDTMDITADFLAQTIKNKTIILTGAMIPFSINCIEATANLMLAIGFLQSKSLAKDIFISMHGAVKHYTTLLKNRKIGKFECHS